MFPLSIFLQFVLRFDIERQSRHIRDDDFLVLRDWHLAARGPRFAFKPDFAFAGEVCHGDADAADDGFDT